MRTGVKIYDAFKAVEGLRADLQKLIERDPEQEVRGIAIPVLEAVLEAVRESLPDDPVVRAVRELFSPQSIIEGEPIRAADALLVATQLEEALKRAKPALRQRVGGF